MKVKFFNFLERFVKTFGPFFILYLCILFLPAAYYRYMRITPPIERIWDGFEVVEPNYPLFYAKVLFDSLLAATFLLVSYNMVRMYRNWGNNPYWEVLIFYMGAIPLSLLFLLDLTIHMFGK